MKTRDRLLAVDTSAESWHEGVPEFPIQDVMLMRLIRVASLGITAFTDPVLRSTGLSESSYHTLIVIVASNAQGITPTALCDQVGQTRANMTRILSLLESEKLVRINPDARDARRRLIVALPAGRKLVRKYARLYAPIVETAFGSLGADDRKTLERLLRALLGTMDVAEQMAAKIA